MCKLITLEMVTERIRSMLESRYKTNISEITVKLTVTRDGVIAAHYTTEWRDEC